MNLSVALNMFLSKLSFPCFPAASSARLDHVVPVENAGGGVLHPTRVMLESWPKRALKGGTKY